MPLNHKKIKEFIKGFDLFAQPVTFRYGDESEYETATGGICSIIMIIIFAAIFTGIFINTFEKKHITSTVSRFQEEDPSYYTVGTDYFMFAISIPGLDLLEGERWFDISMEERSYEGGREIREIELGRCERSQWSRIDKKLGQTYDRVGLEEWLCPSDEQIFELQGKFTSDTFKFYKFSVKKCDPDLFPSRPCVNQSFIQAYLEREETFSFNYYFINTIINPHSIHYLSYFIDDLNYFPFSLQNGVNANLFISSFLVTTDESIWPVQEISNHTGGLVLNTAQILNYQVKNEEYLKFYLRKSSVSLLIERSFKKADDTLSYVGGLFSAILCILIFMNLYNEFSYELEIARTLFNYQKGAPIDSEGFNFFVYLGYLVFLFLDKFGCQLSWERMKKYHHSLEEVRKQMDIRLITKKILYAERMGFAIFDEHQAKILHLQEPLTLEEAEEIRNNYGLHRRIEEQLRVRQSSGLESLQTLNSNSRTSKNRMQSTENAISEEEQSREGEVAKDLDELENMRTYIEVLKKEAESGDYMSEKILEKFDPKLMAMFIAMNEFSKQKGVSKGGPAGKQRKLNVKKKNQVLPE